MKMKNKIWMYRFAVMVLILVSAYSCKKDDSSNSSNSSNVVQQISTPSNPSPADKSTGVYSILTWSACTNKLNYPVIYDVYFGTSSNPSLVQSNITSNQYQLGSLISGTTYYWKISAKDSHNNISTSSVWSFTYKVNITYGTCKDNENNTYKTVTIGTQTWMAENLKTKHYNNGDAIATTTSSSFDISTETNPKYQWAYDGDESLASTLGRLYTWFAITDNRGVCPTGYHIPTEADWKILSDYLGGDSKAGGKMKEASGSYWHSPNTGADNSSGFKGLPGGTRWNDGNFDYIWDTGFFWSSSEDPTHTLFAWYHSLDSETAELINNANDKGTGSSVRCLKD